MLYICCIHFIHAEYSTYKDLIHITSWNELLIRENINILPFLWSWTVTIQISFVRILGIYFATHIFTTRPSTTLRNHVGIEGTGRAEITRDECLYVHYWLQSPAWYDVEKQPQIWNRSCPLRPDRARFHHTSTSISPKPDLSRLINLTVKDSPLLKLGYQLIRFNIGNVI